MLAFYLAADVALSVPAVLAACLRGCSASSRPLSSWFDGRGARAGVAVEAWRADAGRDAYDRCLSDLGELSTQSEEFRTGGRLTTFASTSPASSTSTIPVVGDLSLTYDRLDLVADPGLTIVTYTAEPDSRDQDT